MALPFDLVRMVRVVLYGVHIILLVLLIDDAFLECKAMGVKAETDGDLEASLQMKAAKDILMNVVKRIKK